MDYGCLWPVDILTRPLLKLAIHLSIIIVIIIASNARLCTAPPLRMYVCVCVGPLLMRSLRSTGDHVDNIRLLSALFIRLNKIIVYSIAFDRIWCYYRSHPPRFYISRICSKFVHSLLLAGLSPRCGTYDISN